MLYIRLKYDNGASEDLDWHIGEKSMFLFDHLRASLNSVDMVQADCDELAYIKKNTVEGLPFSYSRVQAWHGDMAKWVVSNIILKS